MTVRGHGGDREAQYIQGVREGFLKKKILISAEKVHMSLAKKRKERDRKIIAGGVNSINRQGAECHNVCMEQIIQYCCKLKFKDGNG